MRLGRLACGPCDSVAHTMLATHETGPFLRSAILCREVTQDTGGNVTAMSGIVSRIGVTGRNSTEPGQMPHVRVELKLVLLLTAGEGGKGKSFSVRVRSEGPEEKMVQRGEAEVSFLDEEACTVNLVVDFALQVAREGAYWFEVYLFPPSHSEDRKRLLTRIPLFLEYRGEGPER